jgi:hypothetical protein
MKGNTALTLKLFLNLVNSKSQKVVNRGLSRFVARLLE